ncbi:MAG: hypothetical protein ACREA0_23755 [bacterium]
MGFTAPYAPTAKGPVTYCLDELSKRPDARQRLVQLRDAIIDLGSKGKSGKGGGFHGLENVFAKHLLVHIYRDPKDPAKPDKERIDRVTKYLKTSWFDEETGWWPHFQPLAPIYAHGLLKTLNASLRGSPPMPIDSYWIIGHTTVELITLKSKVQVTLLIATPPPLDPAPKGIWGESSEAWATARRAGRIAGEVDPTKNDSKVPSRPDWPLRVVTYKITGRPQKT